jgi:hypothetical protein
LGPRLRVARRAVGAKARFRAQRVIPRYTLLELLESIEHLLRHLDIYTQISPTPAMDDMMVKIMVEILFTLAVTAKELKQG